MLYQRFSSSGAIKFVILGFVLAFGVSGGSVTSFSQTTGAENEKRTTIERLGLIFSVPSDMKVDLDCGIDSEVVCASDKKTQLSIEVGNYVRLPNKESKIDCEDRFRRFGSPRFLALEYFCNSSSVSLEYFFSGPSNKQRYRLSARFSKSDIEESRRKVEKVLNTLRFQVDLVKSYNC